MLPPCGALQEDSIPRSLLTEAKWRWDPYLREGGEKCRLLRIMRHYVRWYAATCRLLLSVCIRIKEKTLFQSLSPTFSYWKYGKR